MYIFVQEIKKSGKKLHFLYEFVLKSVHFVN